MQKLLYTIPYKSFDLWDVKRYSKITYKSQYSIELLGKHINSEIEKVELFKFPETTFNILGISNEIGMYDAYDKNGKEFNQSYKVVKNGYIAYNPYRINVGSIGIKTSKLKGDLISPAYVVFSCKNTVMPEFLFLLMKTKWFNAQVKENTSGSVRQNLTFEALSRIMIPVPPLSVQTEIINNYQTQVLRAQFVQSECDYSLIEKILENKLQLQNNCGSQYAEILAFINYSQCFTWDVRDRKNSVFTSLKYHQLPLSTIAQINPPLSQSIKDEIDVSFIPMKCVSGLDGCIKQTRICKSSAKGFTKFENGDIIWAKITPCMQNGKSAIVNNLKNGIGYGSTEFYVIRVNKELVIPEYIYYLLRTYRVREAAVSYFSGSAGQQRVRKSFLEELFIPLPPIEEQKEIVEILDAKKAEIILARSQAENLLTKAKQDFENAIFK